MKEVELEDLRVRRTRKLLSDALFNLLSRNDFKKINVNDICEIAMVNRATFYNHFNDKEDLLKYMLDDIQEKMFEKSIENATFNSSKEMYITLISNVIDFLIENYDKVVQIMKNNSEKMTSLLTNTIKKSIKYLLSKNQFDEKYTLPTDIIVNFFTGGLAMVGLDLLNNKESYSKEEILKFCEILFNEKIYIQI